MWLVGKEFRIGKAIFRGVKYCDPCDRINNLMRRRTRHSFKKSFEDAGGLIAEIITGGMIETGDEIIPPPKGY
jgi:MOSC domain-containing protein YiiM